ncbi:hypothetical protein SLS54_004245 [Diplodia seriata]
MLWLFISGGVQGAYGRPNPRTKPNLDDISWICDLRAGWLLAVECVACILRNRRHKLAVRLTSQAVYTIDTFGRRNLLLTTFPLMGIFLLFCGFSFWIPDNADGSVSDSRIGCVAAAIFLFMVVYSPGEGPVPFTYSAEAFPLYIRDTGMSFATATTWGFNFILSLTWPALVEAFQPQGAFGWYAGWNFVGWIYCYFLLPETKNLTLEELDTVFSVGNREHAQYYARKLPWYLNKYILRKDVPPFPPLYQFHEEHVHNNHVQDHKIHEKQ